MLWTTPPRQSNVARSKRRSGNPAAADGSCQTSTASSTGSWSYDAGDRLSKAGYVFDAFGRNTTLPSVDAPVSANGDVTLGYYDTDAVASITQAGVKTSWSLDAAGGDATRTTTRHYGDSGDDPAWVDVTEGVSTSRTRFESGLGGDLGLTLTGPATNGAAASGAEVTLSDPHGDVVATSQITGQTTPAVGLAGWVDHDEYGNPLGDAMAASAGSGAITQGLGYGRVGAKQRATLDAGLTLMGARVYNRTTGQFTSTDPVFGGNPTTYGYPTDPVNSFDLNGQWGFHMPKWVKKVGRFAANAGRAAYRARGSIARYAGYAAVGACVFATAGVCGAAAAFAAGASLFRRAGDIHAHGGRLSAGGWFRQAAGAALDVGLSRVPGVRYVGKVVKRGAHRAGKHATRYVSTRTALRTKRGVLAGFGQGLAAAWTRWGW